MTAVSAWIVDPQGRPVPGVDVLLTAQGWRGQRWAARSDARGQATFEVPPMNARSAGMLTASVPSLGAERSGRLGEVLLVTAPFHRPRGHEQHAAETGSGSRPLLRRPSAPPPPPPPRSQTGLGPEWQDAPQIAPKGRPFPRVDLMYDHNGKRLCLGERCGPGKVRDPKRGCECVCIDPDDVVCHCGTPVTCPPGKFVDIHKPGCPCVCLQELDPAYACKPGTFLNLGTCDCDCVEEPIDCASTKGAWWAWSNDACGCACPAGDWRCDCPPKGSLPTSGQPCDQCGCKESGQPGCQFATCWLRKPIFDFGCSKDQTGSVAFVDPVGGVSVEKCLAQAQTYPLKCGTPTVVEKFEKGTCV